MTQPIIIFSDHPALPSGLARITRDLAVQINAHLQEDFRVATLGAGHPGTTELPFMTYNWTQRDDFLPLELPYIWQDFCAPDPGILFTIHDIQRMLQLADPKFCTDPSFGRWMREMRTTKQLKLWGYFPIDAHGIGGKLPPQLAHTLTHYDRILVPSKWAQEIVHQTLPSLKVDVLPHGIDTNVFHPIPDAREKWPALARPAQIWPKGDIKIPSDALRIGIVATNQSRKDWGLGVEVVAGLAKTRPVHLWAHSDMVRREGAWSLLELLSEFNLLNFSTLTVGNLSDSTMAVAYSAQDITLGIGRGEGFGYPIAESWACGVPCVAGGYGAHVEYFPDDCAVKPRYLRLEGTLNLLRPIFDVMDWIGPVNDAAGSQMVLSTALDWKYLWQDFAAWFKDGLNG